LPLPELDWKKNVMEPPDFCAARIVANQERQPSGENVTPPWPANVVVWLQMYQTPKPPTDMVTSPSGLNPRYVTLPAQVKFPKSGRHRKHGERRDEKT
jgi:hypothetical protein